MRHQSRIWVHVTAYRDTTALREVHTSLLEQTPPPEQIRVVDNSPEPLAGPTSQTGTGFPHYVYVHRPDNPGTAGAINDSIITARTAGADYLWILDQDSRPAPGLLAGLLRAHNELSHLEQKRVGIVAPLTRNRDDGCVNLPQRFDRYRARSMSFDQEPVSCDFLPASGMLLHLPSLTNIQLPSDHYFLDIYDFALGLATHRAGAGVWLMPTLELSHQVGSKATFTRGHQTYALADMPTFRVRLLHRNTTYLFTRSACGRYRLYAAIWQLRRAWLSAWRYATHPFEDRWAKAGSALYGWLLGLFGLEAANAPRRQK